MSQQTQPLAHHVPFGPAEARNFCDALKGDLVISALKGDLVIIVANPGPDEERCTVHKDVLCVQSDYFEGLCNSGFKESGKPEVELHDIHVEAFQGALYWCYHEQVPGARTDYVRCQIPEYLVELWIVADRLLLHTLQNAVMKELCRLLTKDICILNDWVIQDIYVNTTPGSVLRKFAYHCVAYDAMYPGEDEDAEYLECFEKLENFGRDVWQASREIAKRAAGQVVTPEIAFHTDFFMVSHKDHEHR